MSHKKYDFRTAYIDLLINLLTGTVVLFLLTTLLIAPIVKNNEGIKKNADYVITAEWPEEIDCDVDMWIRDPQNNIVSYLTTEAGLMYLERDDKGKRGNIFGSEVLDPDNKEYITLRGTFPGEYVVNLFVYSCKDPVLEGGMPSGAPVDIPIKFDLIKINPTYSVLKHIELKLVRVHQEVTAIRFVMNDKKTILRYKFDFVAVRGGGKSQ